MNSTLFRLRLERSLLTRNSRIRYIRGCITLDISQLSPQVHQWEVLCTNQISSRVTDLHIDLQAILDLNLIVLIVDQNRVDSGHMDLGRSVRRPGEHSISMYGRWEATTCVLIALIFVIERFWHGRRHTVVVDVEIREAVVGRRRHDYAVLVYLVDLERGR